MPLRTDTLLSVNSVNLSYGPNTVLRDCSFTVRDLIRPGCITGQTLGLLGPSGIGKSTLLRIIAGLQPPTSGTVLLGREQRPTQAGDVGMVNQTYTLWKHRTVLGNLVTAALQAKDKPNLHIAKARSAGVLDQFGLLDKAFMYPAQLSGGQRQRIAIAQQIVTGGELILFDEPTAGLDPLAKTNTCRLIAELSNRTENETVILCSHDISSVVAICDTVLVLGRTAGQPGANIVTEIDLISRGLMWHDDVRRMPEFAATVEELQEMFIRL